MNNLEVGRCSWSVVMLHYSHKIVSPLRPGDLGCRIIFPKIEGEANFATCQPWNDSFASFVLH